MHGRAMRDSHARARAAEVVPGTPRVMRFAALSRGASKLSRFYRETCQWRGAYVASAVQSRC